MAVVLANYLTGEEFLQVFSSLSVDKGYMILDRPETSIFEQFNEDTDWASWDTGRIFNEGMDFHWQKNGGRFHVVMISDIARDYFPPRFNINLIEDYFEQKTRWLLWGQQEAKGKWIERRIPRIFSYPLAAKNSSRIALSVTEYVNAGNRQVEFYRFSGIEEVSPNESL